MQANVARRKDDKGFLCKEDLENDYEEDLKYLLEHQETVYAGDSSAVSSSEPEPEPESKYTHSWADLSPEAQLEAMKKAISAYDRYKSWDRGNDISTYELERKKQKNKSIVSMDCTTVRDAKLKNGKVIGKFRIVPRGFRNKSDKAVWYSTSPTASSVSIRVCEIIGMALGFDSWVFDISDAFFSGEWLHDNEEMWIKLPREILIIEGSNPDRPWRRLRRDVPGCRGASSSWFRRLQDTLISWGWEQSTTDPALFLKWKVVDGKRTLVGLLPVHVDDGKLRATQECADELWENFEKTDDITLSSRDKQLRGKPIEYTGVTYTETAEGEKIDQNDYVRNKLHSLAPTAKRLRGANENDNLTGDDLKAYGTAVGRLIWILPTHAKFSYEISFLSRYRAFPRVKHMRRIAGLIEVIKKNPQHVFIPRFHKGSPIKLIAVVDAGAGEEADAPLKTRDHQCVAVMLVSSPDPKATSLEPGMPTLAGLVSWQSCGLGRVSHSSFDFESICAISSLDLIVNLRELVGEILVGPCPRLLLNSGKDRRAWKERLPTAELHSDSMGLVKAVRLGTNPQLSQRRRRDILDLRDCMFHGEVAVFMHVDGPTNPTDVGTKPNAKTQVAAVELEHLIYRGKYAPKTSRDHSRTFDVNACIVKLVPPRMWWENFD